MATVYTAKAGLPKFTFRDRNWHLPVIELVDDLDNVRAIDAGAVREVEIPSASLNVRVESLTYRKADGTVATYAGVASQAMTTGTTNYVYLTDAGVLTVNTTGFPAATNIVPLATVLAGATTITSVTDARRPYQSFGAAAPAGTVTSVAIAAPGLFTVSGSPVTAAGTLTLALANQAANVVFAGPTTGGAAAPTFRVLVVADLPTTGLVINSFSGAITADADAATIKFNATTSDKHSVILGGNRTLAVTGDAVGQMLVVILKQDATGTRTVTWWAGILWPGGAAPTLTTTANKTDVFRILKTGAGAYLGLIMGQNL